MFERCPVEHTYNQSGEKSSRFNWFGWHPANIAWSRAVERSGPGDYFQPSAAARAESDDRQQHRSGPTKFHLAGYYRWVVPL